MCAGFCARVCVCVCAWCVHGSSSISRKPEQLWRPPPSTLSKCIKMWSTHAHARAHVHAHTAGQRRFVHSSWAPQMRLHRAVRTYRPQSDGDLNVPLCRPPPIPWLHRRRRRQSNGRADIGVLCGCVCMCVSVFAEPTDCVWRTHSLLSKAPNQRQLFTGTAARRRRIWG